MKEAGAYVTSGSSNFSLERKLRSSTAPVNKFLRRVRTIVVAPRAEGDAKVTSTTAKGSPSTFIIIRRFNSFAPINATRILLQQSLSRPPKPQQVSELPCVGTSGFIRVRPK